MKSFKKYISEAPIKIKAKLGRAVSAGGHGSGRDEKGWAHKSGKLILWKGMKPYHVQYIVKNLSKFGLKEKEVLDVLEARMDSFGAPNPKEDAKKHLEQLIAGTPIDRDPTIEYLAMKRGWCRVVLGKFASIGGYDIRTIHQVAKQIDKKKDWTTGIKSLELWEYGESNGSIKKGNQATTKMAGSLDNSYDVGLWVDGKSADPSNVGKGRTEIGRTMAQFREGFKRAMRMDPKTPHGRAYNERQLLKNTAREVRKNVKKNRALQDYRKHAAKGPKSQKYRDAAVRRRTLAQRHHQLRKQGHKLYDRIPATWTPEEGVRVAKDIGMKGQEKIEKKERETPKPSKWKHQEKNK